MKTKTLLTLLIMLFAYNLKAQSHISKGDYKCLLVPNSGNGLGGVSCPACAKTEKAEREAKATEDKRRAVAHAEKIKKDKIASDLAYKKKQQERAEKNKSTEVYVTMPKSTALKNTTPDNKTESKGMVKNYFYTEKNDNNNQRIFDMYKPISSNYFIINNQKKFNNNEFKACIGVYTNEYFKDANFPPNIGIVVLNELHTDKNGKSIQISDLIDSKGNRILNDNSISTIIHFANDYFIVFKGFPSSGSSNNVTFYRGQGDAYIYNLKTKQNHLLQRYTNDEGMDGGYDVDYVINLVGNPMEIDRTKYKARFKSKTGWKEETYYYITKDNKIEEQIIKY